MGQLGRVGRNLAWRALYFAKRGWRTEVVVAAYTVASESQRVKSPSVVSHEFKTHLILVDQVSQLIAYKT